MNDYQDTKKKHYDSSLSWGVGMGVGVCCKNKQKIVWRVSRKKIVPRKTPKGVAVQYFSPGG